MNEPIKNEDTELTEFYQDEFRRMQDQGKSDQEIEQRLDSMFAMGERVAWAML